MPELHYEILELRTRHDFNIARAAAPPVRRNVRVTVRDGEFEGWGEAGPNAFYAETADTVVEALAGYRPIVERAGADLAAVDAALLAALPSRHPKYPPHPAARSAISAALLDLAAKRAGRPVWDYLGLKAHGPVSSFTIGIAEPAIMRERAREARGYEILKVKVGTSRDEEVLKLLREEAPHARIRVDANTGWTAGQAIALLPMLKAYDVELIEQPVPADDHDGLARITKVSEIPVIADESCRVSSDVAALAGRVHGVNIKLAKCGSVLEAIRIAEAARRHDMQVMIGCMIESTLGIAAAIQVASLCDYADLDGAALLANDPFTGPGIDRSGRLRFNEQPGLGVSAA
jgi:L-alanine-DL-glutamate epimerase-like enolase superfamily enzyme